MAKKNDGFLTLVPKPGGKYDKYMKTRKGTKRKIPKNPNKLIEQEIEERGMANVIKTTEVNIGDYVYDKGLIHALNMNVGRNIPWIEDGLKSAERRVLYIMHNAKLYGGHGDKVASIAGKMIEKVYPHGDQAASDVIFRLGRLSSAMIPYIANGENFGNMYDQRPASPRYAAASLSDYAMDCFFSENGSINPLYDTKPNYTYSDTEPVFLCSRYPNVLLQWNQGIGKGAAAWVGAFNSKDLFKAAIEMLDNPDAKIKIFPDCPTPVDIVNKNDLKNCFDKTNFKVRMRARYYVAMDTAVDPFTKRERDKYTIVFTSCPVSTKGKTIVNEIIALNEEDAKKGKIKKLPEVLNVECDADEDALGIKIVVEYVKGYDPDALAEKLFRMTSLEKTIGVNYNMITENRPCLYTPREIMTSWISQRFDQKRRYYHQRVIESAKDYAKLSAICTIINDPKNIDKALDLIKNSTDYEHSIASLCKAFGFTEFQAIIVLDIRIKILAKMSINEQLVKRDKAADDYKTYRKILTEQDAIKNIIRDELKDGLKKYGKDRMAVVRNLDNKLDAADDSKYLFYNDETYYCLDDVSNISSIATRLDNSYKVLKIKNSDTIAVFGSNGGVKVLNGYSFTSNVTGVGYTAFEFTNIAGIIPIASDDKKLKVDNYIAFITKDGYGKLMETKEFNKLIKGKAINLNSGDSLTVVIPVANPDGGIIGMLDGDKMYYLKTSNIPVLKRTSAGNRLIKGVDGLNITHAVYLSDSDKYILIYGESGYMKVLDMLYLGFAKRGNNLISNSGKTICGVVPIRDAVVDLKMIDSAGELGINLVIDKTIKFTASTGESQKFKMSTSIGSPVKVLKKGKNEFYNIM